MKKIICVLTVFLIYSGNDAGIAIADHIAGSEQAFAELMNQKAKEIGAVDTHFVNSHGLHDENHYTTAYDLALIAKEALTHEKICASVKKEKARNILISGEDVTWYNTNKLVKNGSGYYYSYAIGLKTGTSTEAGRCLVSAAKKEDQTYVSVIMDASPEGRWKDSIQLLKYGIEG